jgi:hypothetical protein
VQKKGCRGLGDFNVTNKTKKLNSFIGGLAIENDYGVYFLCVKN